MNVRKKYRLKDRTNKKKSRLEVVKESHCVRKGHFSVYHNKAISKKVFVLVGHYLVFRNNLISMKLKFIVIEGNVLVYQNKTIL